MDEEQLSIADEAWGHHDNAEPGKAVDCIFKALSEGNPLTAGVLALAVIADRLDAIARDLNEMTYPGREH